MKKKLLVVALVLLALLAALSAAFPLGFAAGEEAKLIKFDGRETPYSTLAAAMNEAEKGDRILLLKDLTVSSQITIKAGVTLDGGGHMIKGDKNANWGNNHIILFGNNSTLKNVIIDGDGNKVRGVQAWGVTNVRIDNVTIRKTFQHGLKISGSTVTASRLTIKDTKGKILAAPAIDMQPTTVHPTLSAEQSVLILLGTKITLEKSDKISTDNKDGCIVDARNYTGDAPANSSQPGHISDTDNRYHQILWQGKFNKHFEDPPKREYITYFNVDEHGNILNASGSRLVTYNNVGEYPAMHPVKEQAVGGQHNATKAVTLDPPTLTREGYQFLGWTTKPDGTGTVYQADETIYGNHNKDTDDKWDDDLILYAKWRKLYTVTYVTGDQTGTPIPNGGTFAEGETVTISTTSPTASGFRFIGWKYNDTETIYKPSATFTMPASDVVLTAQWSREYHIAYALAGGTSPTNPTNPEIYTAEDLPIVLNNPTKEGNIFLGWTGSNGTTLQTTVIILQGTTGDLSYTANWRPTTLYTVTYRLGMGAAPGVAAPVEGEKAEGEVIQVKALAPANGQIGKDSRTFVGWKYSDGTNSHPIYQPGAEFNMPARNVILTAQWKNYRVVFTVENGKTRDGGFGRSVLITDGTLHPEDIPTGLIPEKGYQPSAEGWKQVSPTADVHTVNTAVGGVVAVAGAEDGIMYTYTFEPIPHDP